MIFQTVSHFLLADLDILQKGGNGLMPSQAHDGHDRNPAEITTLSL